MVSENPSSSITNESEMQHLRLQLAEKEQYIQQLVQEIERLRFLVEDQVSTEVSREIENLFTQISGPISQLILQDYLLNEQDKPIQAKDVLSVARRLVRICSDSGLEPVGEIGRQTAFNPNLHMILSTAIMPELDDSVTVRVPGMQYRGKILRKAGVERP